MIKVLLLFSGGLDSILAAKILKEQKIEIIPICFKSFFFDCETAKKYAKKLRFKLKIEDISKEQLKIVKFPTCGRGKGINPCIDCHLLMLKTAGKIIKKGKVDFLATGDVLGERPFSQNRESFNKIDEKANLKGLVLRPLSAKLLPKTIPEKRGMIKREKLYAISGKSRKPQIKLAKKFKIKDFPSPAGGCILTNLEYSRKLKELFKKNSKADGRDCQALRKGRAVWEEKKLFLIGRNEKENRELKELRKKKDKILEPDNFSGPTVLIKGFGKKIKKENIKRGTELLFNYSKKLPDNIKIKIND